MNRELFDGLVRLRPYRAEDADSHFEAAIESVVAASPWLPWCHAGYTREDSVQWIASREEAWRSDSDYSFAILEYTTGAFLGGCAVNRIDRVNLRANLGYWVRTSRTGRGFATAAARLLARFAFDELGLQRIEILAAVGNVASRRVARKLGAVEECVAKNRLRLAGRQHDAVCFSLIPENSRK
ncbi:MAG: GNAT family N-acetyltransferase [Pirellulales bacterium]